MTRKPFVGANWKMHGNRTTIGKLLGTWISAIDKNPIEVDIAIFPPAIYLPLLLQYVVNTPIRFGAQTMGPETQGAYTGEIAPSMLLEFGCRYVLVGHSERRQLFGERNSDVARKVALAKTAGLLPVICVGETLDAYQQGNTHTVIEEQMQAILQDQSILLQDAIIAYEPVWAIGTGLAATPDQAEWVHQHIRSILARADTTLATTTRIIYGGSVKPENAADLFAMPNIDGALVGGASLDAAAFWAICVAATNRVC